MTKQELDAQLKRDAAENEFKVDGDYIVFSKKSKLDYQVVPHFKLKELLTKNPLSTETKLNKNLLVMLNSIREAFGKPLVIRATYRSPEYALTSFGSADSDLYTKGDAVSMGCPADQLNDLITAVESVNPGEIGIYSWGCHVGYSKEQKQWDKRDDQSFKQKMLNVISNDSLKNWLLIGAAAAAGWFFFLRKK